MNRQILFSLKFLLKQWGILTVMLVLFIIIPFLLISLESLDSLEHAWYSMLQLQMIVAVLLAPTVLHSIWKGQVQSFEKKLILYHLRKPVVYFFSKLFAVWLVMSGILVFFYTILWLLSNQASSVLWYSTILQIILTIAFAVVLTGFLSLLLKRTIYGTIIMILYLIISIQFIRQPMIGLWFNPDFIQQTMLEPAFLIQRCILLCWIGILLLASKALFMRQVV